jgi:hypothetical protein
VSTSEDQAVAVGHSVEAAQWAAETGNLLDRMAGRFVRVETRRRAGRFVEALLAHLPRKNCWSVAEHAGNAGPYGMQHFLSRASWDTDGVRDDQRDYVIGALADTDAVASAGGTIHGADVLAPAVALAAPAARAHHLRRSLAQLDDCCAVLHRGQLLADNTNVLADNTNVRPAPNQCRRAETHSR